MKNPLRGGLKALIPNRSVEDPDDVIDDLDEEFEDDDIFADEVGEEEVAQEPEVEEEVDSDVEEPTQSARVSVVSEDETEEDEELFKEAPEEVPVVDEPTGVEEVPEVEEDDSTSAEDVTAEAEEVVMAADILEDESDDLEITDEDTFKAPSKPNVTPLTFDVDLSGAVAKKAVRKKAVVRKAVASTEVKAKSERVVIKSEEVTQKPKIEENKEKFVAKVAKTVEAESDAQIWDKHEGDVLHIKVKDIAVNSSQPRRKFDQVELEELIRSIAHHGILQPLVVRRTETNYELVAGERRLRAAKSLNWESVPCVVRKEIGSGASMLELALIENIQRQDLNAVEEAMAYRQLNEEYGMTHEEIGERVGRSRVGVTNVIRILQLPDEIQRGLVEEKIAIGHAKAILMIPDEEKQIRFYRHLVEEGLTVRKAETRARRIQRTMNIDDPMRQKRKGRSAFEMKYSGLLEDRFGYDSKLKFNEQKNRYEVMFKCHSKDEIDELLGRLMGTNELPGGLVDEDVIDDE